MHRLSAETVLMTDLQIEAGHLSGVTDTDIGWGRETMSTCAYDCEQTYELMTFAYTAKLLHDNLNGSGSLKGIGNRVVMAFLDTLSSRLPEIVEALGNTTEEISLERYAA